MRKFVRILSVLFLFFAFVKEASCQNIKFITNVIGHPLVPDLMTRAAEYGWTGFQPHAGPWWADEHADIEDAQAAGMTWIMAWISHDSVFVHDWKFIHAAIDSGKAWGVTCFYLDDCYSAHPDSLSVADVDSVAHWVHNAGFKLAAAEDNLQRVQYAASLGGYDSVDYIVPYHYMDSTASLFQTYLQQMRAAIPNKPFIPQLGYHADGGNTNPIFFYPDQLGSQGGGNGIIEVAEQYADLGVISYYTYFSGEDSTWKLNYFYKLTNYLQVNGYMSGTPAPVGIQLNQKLQSGTSVGTIGVWNSSSFVQHASGDTAFLTRTSTQTIQASDSVYSAQKYNNWTRNSVEEPNILNFHQFTTIEPYDSVFTSHFIPTAGGITVQANDVGGTGEATSVGFSDPWFVDYADSNYGSIKRNQGTSAPLVSRTSPFYPNMSTSYGGDMYKGVFEGQSGPPNWKPPYYTISFPSQSVTVGGTSHNIQFINWTASGATLQNPNSASTPVVFTSSSATVTANVKGNLLSSVSSATGYGNQCKIIKDPATGYLFMIYPSAGEIWYTRSTDQGRTWSPEVRISAGDGEARNPSIAQVWNENGTAVISVFVVWVDEYPGLGSGWSVFYNSLDVSTNTWGTTMPVAPPNGGTPVGFARSNAKPSISAITNTSGGSYLTVAFEGYNTGIYIASKSWNDTAWQPLEELSFTDTTCEDPALFAVNYPSVGGFYMYLAYDNAQSVFMSYVSNPTNYDPPPFGSATNITSSIEQGEAAELGLTVDGSGTVRFTWRGYDPFANAFVTWERSYTWAGGSWNTAEFSTPSSSDEPSICGHLGGAGATIMFHVNNNSLWKVESNNGTSWSGATQLASSAAYPGLVSTANADTIPFVYTKLTTPYAIGMGEVNSGNVTLLQKASPASGNMKHSQAVEVIDTSTGLSARFDLSNVQLTGTGKAAVSARLAQLGRGVRREGHIVLNPSMNTALSNTGSHIDFEGRLQVEKDGGSRSLSLALMDSTSNSPLIVLMKSELSGSMTGQSDSLLSVAVPMGLAERASSVAVLVNGKVDTNATVTLVDVYSIGDTGSSVGSGQLPASIAVPTDYDLSQNYPNPFNPTTVINYQLPKDSHVTLKVYDVLGREVATLVNGDISAGYHQAIFDGSDVASGVYFYRLTTPSYTKVMKMLLIK